MITQYTQIQRLVTKRKTRKVLTQEIIQVEQISKRVSIKPSIKVDLNINFNSGKINIQLRMSYGQFYFSEEKFAFYIQTVVKPRHWRSILK